MERAFDPVVTAKLEDIKASFKFGLTEQKEQLEEMMDTKLENLDENLDTKFENQNEMLKRYIGNLVRQFGQLLELKLQEQNEDFNQKLEQQKA